MDIRKQVLSFFLILNFIYFPIQIVYTLYNPIKRIKPLKMSAQSYLISEKKIIINNYMHSYISLTLFLNTTLRELSRD